MSFEQLVAELGDGGTDFERLCKWLLENAPEYRQKLRRVWRWDEWPGRWGADAGIDLVAEAEDGLWAVQSKHYGSAYSIRKADIDSFLSESSRPEFSYRLLIASTDHVGRTARRTLAAQEKPAGMLLRSQLLLMEVEWPSSLADLRPQRPLRKSPRPHQHLAIDACEKGLSEQDRGQLVMACGTGKTVVGALLAKQLAARRVLVLVPSLSLLAQTLREWGTATDFTYLAVCSDETVTQNERDAVVASTSELGFPVTTDPGVIANFLHEASDDMRLVLATYQSSPRIAEAQAAGTSYFDLAIADEAHRCAGPKAGVFATVLDPTRITARKRLFMTATPRYFTGRVKRKALAADWEIASMDDDAAFGRVLHSLSFASAIEQDLLSDYQVVVVGATDRAFRAMAQRGTFVRADGETVTDARTLASQIGLLRAMESFNLRRVVSFHSRIDHASRFASSLVETYGWLPAHHRPTGKLWADHVSGKMTAGERDVRLQRLKAVGGDERGVITNARCLNEGVDVPTLDGVAFIDPRRSQIDVVQAVGRAIRKSEDKTVGTIIIPVFVDTDGDPEQVLASGEFESVWQVVRALRAHDEDLASELDELRRELGRRGTVGLPGKVRLDLPVDVGEAFARAFDARLVEHASSDWEEGFGAACAYREANGDLRVHPRFVTEEGLKLGAWIGNRRSERIRGTLSRERIAELDVLGMVWDPREEQWQRGIAAATAYWEANGHLNVPHGHVTADGFRLAQWVGNRRVDRRQGELAADRAAALDALGMVWNIREQQWLLGIAAANTYREANGHLQVPFDFTSADGFQLGNWIAKQRRDWARGVLSRDRIAALDALGMIWDAKDENWRQGIDAATEYRSVNGHLRVPALFVADDGYRLGVWIANWRKRRELLSDEQIAQLDALGMMWDPFGSDWDQGTAACRRYHAAHGQLRVQQNFVDDAGYPLGRWVAKQRQKWKKGKLSVNERTELESLGMVWDPYQQDWQVGLAHALDYHGAHGDLRVPVGFVTDDGFQLGKWLSRRRHDWRVGRINPDRIAQLDALGMPWDQVKAPAPDGRS